MNTSNFCAIDTRLERRKIPTFSIVLVSRVVDEWTDGYNRNLGKGFNTHLNLLIVRRKLEKLFFVEV